MSGLGIKYVHKTKIGLKWDNTLALKSNKTKPIWPHCSNRVTFKSTDEIEEEENCTAHTYIDTKKTNPKSEEAIQIAFEKINQANSANSISPTTISLFFYKLLIYCLKNNFNG